jgi:hypothetical protein
MLSEMVLRKAGLSLVLSEPLIVTRGNRLLGNNAPPIENPVEGPDWIKHNVMGAIDADTDKVQPHNLRATIVAVSTVPLHCHWVARRRRVRSSRRKRRKSFVLPSGLRLRPCVKFRATRSMRQLAALRALARRWRQSKMSFPFRISTSPS